MKKNISTVTLAIALGFASTSAAPLNQKDLFLLKRNALLSGLDTASVCLAEQIKAPEDRRCMINSLGLIAANTSLVVTERFTGYSATSLTKLLVRFIGGNIGEGLNLAKAIKNKRFKERLKSITKRDFAAFVAKLLLTTVITPQMAEKVVKRNGDAKATEFLAITNAELKRSQNMFYLKWNRLSLEEKAQLIKTKKTPKSVLTALGLPNTAEPHTAECLRAQFLRSFAENEISRYITKKMIFDNAVRISLQDGNEAMKTRLEEAKTESEYIDILKLPPGMGFEFFAPKLKRAQ